MKSFLAMVVAVVMMLGAVEVFAADSLYKAMSKELTISAPKDTLLAAISTRPPDGQRKPATQKRTRV